MSAKEKETITHRILQKSTGKAIGSARIFPQYSKLVEDLDIKLVHCDKISDNNNEVVKILNEDLNMSSSEDDEVDFEDMIIKSIKDLRRSEDVNGISSDGDNDSDVHKTINLSCETSSELGETTKSDSSTKSRTAALKSKSNKSHGRGETSKSSSSAHTSASSQRVTLKSFYQKLEDDSPDRKWERVKCKLCALVGIEKIVGRNNFSHHVKNIHEARDEKSRRGSCEYCGKLITKTNLSTHRKKCARKKK